MSNIKIKNLQFSYDNHQIFNNLTFTLKKDKTLSIIGTSGSGKTTLLKILNGELSFLGEVKVNDKKIFNKSDIAVVYKDYNYYCRKVKEELVYHLNKSFLDIEEIKVRLKELTNFFDLSEIVETEIDTLDLNDKTLIKILSIALLKPTYIALDNLLVNLNSRTKVLLLNYLNSCNILLINVTSNMEEILYTDYVLCLYEGISAIDGKTLDVITSEKLLKRLGFSLPFMVDLSLQLMDYDLLSRIYLDKELMVRDLWR